MPLFLSLMWASVNVLFVCECCKGAHIQRYKKSRNQASKATFHASSIPFREGPTRFLSRVRRTSAHALVECCLTLVLRHATLRPRLVGGSRQGFILGVDVHAISQVWIEVQQPRKRRVQKVKGNDWGTSFARLLPHKDDGDCGERWQ